MPSPIFVRHRFRRAIVALTFASLAACSDGGSVQKPLPSPSGRSAVSPAKTVSVAFTMHWPSASSAAQKRTPLYVPATARSVGVTVNGGTPQYLNDPGTTLTIAADPGLDTFAFQTFDEANGQGNALSRASITQTVVSGTANVVSAVLNGVIANVSISLPTPTTDAGIPATVPVTVAALDADGNVIVGSSDYDRPITLKVDDPEKSGAVSLSTTLIQTPGTSVTLAYDGATLGHADVTATANGVPPAVANFDPTPNVEVFGSHGLAYPSIIRPGPNGKMIFLDPFNETIGTVDAAGKLATFHDPTNTSISDVVLGSDGLIYFSETSANKIASVTLGLTGYTEYSLLSATDQPGSLIDHKDGYLYAADVVAKTIDRIQLGGGDEKRDIDVPAVVSLLTNGPDNNIYFFEESSQKFGFLPPSMNYRDAEQPGTPDIGGITAGPDGDIWYTDVLNSAAVKETPGTLTPSATYLTLEPGEQPAGITTGADGALVHRRPCDVLTEIRARDDGRRARRVSHRSDLPVGLSSDDRFIDRRFALDVRLSRRIVPPRVLSEPMDDPPSLVS